MCERAVAIAVEHAAAHTERRIAETKHELALAFEARLREIGTDV
jgi:hypothetical protein